MRKFATRGAAVGALSLGLCLVVGCGGPGLTKANFKQIKEGTSTKEDVDKLLGSQGTKVEGEEGKKYAMSRTGPLGKFGNPGGFGPGKPGGPGFGKPGKPDEETAKKMTQLQEDYKKKIAGKNEAETKKLEAERDKAIGKLMGDVPLDKGPEGGLPPDFAAKMKEMMESAEVYRWGDTSKGVVCIISKGKVTRAIPVGL